MKILPQKELGKISIILILIFFLFLSIFFILVNIGERGGETFFSNLKLTIPILTAFFSATAAFITGTLNIIKNKEISLLNILSTILGLLITLFFIAEIISPH